MSFSMRSKINKFTFFKVIFDKMIPEDRYLNMPAFSKVINVKKFMEKSILNNKQTKIVDSIFSKYIQDKKKNKNINVKKFSYYQMQVEKILHTNILEAYFSSKKVLSILEKKTKKLGFYKNHRDGNIRKYLNFNKNKLNVLRKI